jgi:hypothetical protein
MNKHITLADIGHQQALIKAYQQQNYDPLTRDIDQKILAVRLKQNQAKHKIQDQMLRKPR